MAELSPEERIDLAVKFIAQSPPGEVNDVINDIRAIINDDAALMPAVRPALREYNLTQLHTVEHAADGDVPLHLSIISEAAIVPGTAGESERYVDHDGQRSFAFDHINLKASDYEPYTLPDDEEAFRAELATSWATYSKNHFQAGLSSVTCSQFPLLPPEAEPEAAPVSAVLAAGLSPENNLEPEPTPADGSVAPPVGTVDELDQPGALEKLDEEVEEVKVAEEKVENPVEPDATPADGPIGLSVEAEDEIDETGALDKLDNEVEEAKEAEDVAGDPVVEETKQEGLELSAEKGEPVVGDAGAEGVDVAADRLPSAVENMPTSSQEEAEEVDSAIAETEAAPAVAAPVSTREPRKQERVENPVYTLEIVGNRYNPGNFWTGRWRTRWIVDKAQGKVDGVLHVDAHYFEQGNVQLATKHSASFAIPTEALGGQSVASQIVTAIANVETNYQLEMRDVYEELGDQAFRTLRRALPVTRQKVDWDKIFGYTLGSDLKAAA